MARCSCKLHTTRKCLNRPVGFIDVFLALCVLCLGFLVFVFTSRDALAFGYGQTLQQLQHPSNYVREARWYSQEQKSSTTPKPQPSNDVQHIEQQALEHVNSAIVSEPPVKPNVSEQAVSNTSNAMLKLTEHLRDQVRFLRDAIEKAHLENQTLAKEPNCTGDRRQGEVEDLLCMPRPNFIKEVRNPCWWDKTGNNSTLRCLPFFHILGCEKCASSDLWDRITSHPHAVRITGTLDKEANWWGWLRYGRFHYVSKPVKPFVPGYTDSFSPLAKKVEESLKSGGNDHKYLVTGDGTPSDLMDFRGWRNMTQNRGRKLPHVLTPHLMKHIYPTTTKFIVILRDPIERLYSDFIFATLGKSAEGFHDNLMTTLSRMADCIRKQSVRECFYGLQMYSRGRLRLHLILYSLYISEWLKVIPRERFLFLKTEEYKKDPHGTIKRCFEFLGLEPVGDEVLQKIVQQPHALEGRKKKWLGPMWRSTKDILEEIVKPSMHFLPEILQDDRFVWNFNLTPVANR